MHCWIELSREALLHNYAVFMEMAGVNQVIPVLKSNAYGHGLEEIYGLLKEAKPPWIGVTYTEEARNLRQLGYQGRLINLGPVSTLDISESRSIDLEVLLGDEVSLEAWKKLSPSKRPKLHVKVDTGLSRRGFSLEQLEAVFAGLKGLDEDVVGLATHLANVEDVTNTDFAHSQLNLFLRATKMAKDLGFEKLLTHCSSSASTLIIKEPKFDLHRVGISLYGLWPSDKTRLSFFAFPSKPDIFLRPVLSWKTLISSVRELPEGAFVGYGCTFKASRKMKIAVIPVGYYEGYPRLAAVRGAYVIVQGKRCPIVGRICMNMAMIDLENLRDVQVGDTVTLLGRDGAEEVSAEQIAQWADTINYEVVTRLNPRIPRRITP